MDLTQGETGIAVTTSPPAFTCQLTQSPTDFPHFWEHTVGSGHAPLALRADWQQQLRRAHEELGFRHVRFHGILSDDMGTLTCQDHELLYSFFNTDQVIDFLLSIGMRPLVELSFMPETLASGDTTVFAYRANVTPPRDYALWGTLIETLVSHWVERYGAEEVRHWLFEVWNEPNLTAFWTGGQDGYFTLYRETAAAIKRVDDALRMGGPATADNTWVAEFLAYCRDNALPVDFVTTHHYPTDAFGTPGADTITQLEHARRYAMRDAVRTVRSEAGTLPLYYTEWNISSNSRDPMHDGSFAAAFATRIIMEARGLAQGYSWWTFSDIFTEHHFPSVPFHGGFGLLNVHGIAKPSYRAFQLLHQSGTELLDVVGTHDTASAWVTRTGNTLKVLMTNLAMPRHNIQSQLVQIRLSDAAAPNSAWIERIDDDHANPRALWETMGKPSSLSARQLVQLHAASVLRQERQAWTHEDNAIALAIVLPPQSVACVTIVLP
ncbi:cellulase family glycosylhydrolase [soil metagenome]